MPVKIGKGAKIGDNNAIGENATVKVSNKRNNERKKEDKSWFLNHPWLSAIICSLIASIIMLLNWDKILIFIGGLFKSS